MSTLRVVVSGATGRIGRALCAQLIEHGSSVVVFSRSPEAAPAVVAGGSGYVKWDGSDLTSAAREELAAADAVVHLAGGPLFDGRRHRRRDIERESAARVRAMRVLVDGLSALDRRPSVLIAASSVGYYGFDVVSDEIVTEEFSAGGDWWGRDSAEMEAAAGCARELGIRSVALRTGYVLSRASLATQIEQFRRHFGGWVLPGDAWTPWIHLSDEVGLIERALGDELIEGPLNATAPGPVTNRAFAEALGRALARRPWLPIPSAFLRMGLGDVADIVARGRRVVPAKALARDYGFQFPTIDVALDAVLQQGAPTP